MPVPTVAEVGGVAPKARLPAPRIPTVAAALRIPVEVIVQPPMVPAIDVIDRLDYTMMHAVVGEEIAQFQG